MTTGLELGLVGKSVIVTGASSGIGAAAASALGSAGASVLLAGRDENRLKQQVARVEAAGGRGVAAIADLEDAGAASGLVDRALEEFGGLTGWCSPPACSIPSRWRTPRSSAWMRPVEDQRGRAAAHDPARRAAPGRGVVHRVRGIDHCHRRIPRLLGLHRDQGRRGLRDQRDPERRHRGPGGRGGLLHHAVPSRR
jgi:hypothetical protein